MIESTQTVTVRVGIDRVWDYVKDIRRWADLMPGLQDCQVIDDDNSHWVLKVGVGALVRTVRVDVHVDQWDGPERVAFSFKLRGDPVAGGGSYLAVRTGSDEIEMTLTVRVEGTGPMAPMWEAMGGPLLPKFALAFAQQLRDGIEAAMGDLASESADARSPTRSRGVIAWLRRLWRALFGTGRN
jgi:carbon monoxide dehydrogenase subunit G